MPRTRRFTMIDLVVALALAATLFLWPSWASAALHDSRRHATTAGQLDSESISAAAHTDSVDFSRAGGRVQSLVRDAARHDVTATPSHTYDPFNGRIEKIDHSADPDVTTRFHFGGAQAIEETDAAATPAVQRYYVWGAAIETSYDGLNRRNVLKRDASQLADYDYVGSGGRVKSLIYETGANDVTLTQSYDGGARLTRMAYSQMNNTSLPDFSYTFDAASNILTKTFEHRSATPTEAYNYDTLHRLTHTAFNQRTLTPYEGFVYDNLRNRLTLDDDGSTTAYLYNEANELTKQAATQVYYDKKGNLTKDADGYAYFYNRQNMLTRVEDDMSNRIASYAYDPFDRRIEKDIEGGAVAHVYWNGDQILEETDDAGPPAMQRYYVWGASYIDELLLLHDETPGGGGNDYYTCTHHNFNVVALLDNGGAVVERYDYNPYGQRFVLDANYAADADGLSDVGNTVGHQGLFHDTESGLIYNRARMLHAGLGRFMQRDPFQRDPGDP